MYAKIIMLIIFFLLTIGIGIYSRKMATNVNDFVLGGRKVGPWLTAFSYGTTYFSAVIFVGYAGQFGWKFGMASTWIGLGNAFIGSLLPWLILGRRTRVMTKHLNSATMPDFFEKRYKSKGLKLTASAIIFIFLIPYTASLYNGLSRIFGMAFNIDYSVCIIAMAVLTGVYVILGGYVATAWNDFFQGIIMLFGIVAVILTTLKGQGGFSEAVNAMSQVQDEALKAPAGSFTSIFGPNPLGILWVILLTSCGTWGLPQMVHKFYAIKDERSIKIAAIVSTAFAVIIAGGCYFLGGFGRLFDTPEIYNAKGAVIFDSIVPKMLSTLPDALIGLVVILVLSASMSTLSSLVLTSSSTLTLDFIKGTFAKGMNEKKQMLVMRSLLVFFILISAVLALIQYKSAVTFIAQLMGISWGALAGSFLAPFLYGLYWKRATKAGVLASFFTGVGITVTNLIFAYIKSPITAGVIAMGAGLVVVPLVSLLTAKPDGNAVNQVFSCYEAEAVQDK
jgi:SSS family solute:Na+ symporter